MKSQRGLISACFPRPRQQCEPAVGYSSSSALLLDPAGSRRCAQTEDFVVHLKFLGAFYPGNNQPPLSLSLSHTHTHTQANLLLHTHCGPAVQLVFHLCVLTETNGEQTRGREGKPSDGRTNGEKATEHSRSCSSFSDFQTGAGADHCKPLHAPVYVYPVCLSLFFGVSANRNQPAINKSHLCPNKQSPQLFP